MKKVTILSIISVGLFIANLILIWMLMSGEMGPRRKERPKKIIIEKLHFDAPQTKKYEELIDWHQEHIRKSETQMLELKKRLYTNLQTENQTASTDSLITEIGKVQTEIEQINYKHFEEIKQLCKPEQIKLFDQLCTEIADLFAHKPMPTHEK